MTLTTQERDRLTVLWRELARQTRHFVANPSTQHPEFRRLAAEATKWLSPLDDYSDSFVLFGFARLAAGIAKAKVAGFTARGRAVAHVAELVGEILAPPPEPPRLPFRADIDG